MPPLRGIMPNVKDRRDNVKPRALLRFTFLFWWWSRYFGLLDLNARRLPPPWSIEKLDAMSAKPLAITISSQSVIVIVELCLRY
jgi:hypothetical protein